MLLNDREYFGHSKCKNETKLYQKDLLLHDGLCYFVIGLYGSNAGPYAYAHAHTSAHAIRGSADACGREF